MCFAVSGFSAYTTCGGCGARHPSTISPLGMLVERKKCKENLSEKYQTSLVCDVAEVREVGTTASLASGNSQYDGFRCWLRSILVRVSVSHY